MLAFRKEGCGTNHGRKITRRQGYSGAVHVLLITEEYRQARPVSGGQHLSFKTNRPCAGEVPYVALKRAKHRAIFSARKPRLVGLEPRICEGAFDWLAIRKFHEL